MVISLGHIGRERRKASTAERRRFAQENPVTAAAHASESYWHSFIPRPLLVAMLLLAWSGFLWHEISWRSAVAAQAALVPETRARVEKIEQALTGSRDDIAALHKTDRETRYDMLRFYIWTAERVGDKATAAQFRGRLKELVYQDNPQAEPQEPQP